MQTAYNKASNIIDLAELRRRQALGRRDSLARRPRETPWASQEAPGSCPAALAASREERRRARRERCAWRLDVCASLAVILMTAAFALRILI